jgi:hypothetical protein
MNSENWRQATLVSLRQSAVAADPGKADSESVARIRSAKVLPIWEKSHACYKPLHIQHLWL